MGVELGPGDAGALVIHFQLIAVAFGKEIGHQLDQGVGGEGLPLFHPFVNFQLKASQGGHDEKVAVEIGHRLFNERNLEVGIGLGAEEVVAHQGLIEVGGDFGRE